MHDGLVPNWDYETMRDAAESGRLTAADWAEIRRWALAGDANAQFLLSQSELKRKTRQKWLEAARAGGSSDAYYALHGVELERVHESAEAGVISAQVALGIYYATLRSPDLRKSRHWYLQAALQGDGCAMYEIGFTLLLGEGGPPDPIQAIQWLEKAALVDTWHTEDARRLLGDVYHEGLYGVAKDLERGEYWRSLSASGD